jgi:histidyl-tRNA synthetase
VATVEAKTLKGFRDFLPEQMAPRQVMLRAIEDAFARAGFVPLMTPALEYLETLMGKYGEEGDKLLYRFADHGERNVALRYDLTVPLARVVAQHRGELQLPFRRYQIAPVWRADKPQRGRFREFMQCDADIAGVNSAVADAEVLTTGLTLLRTLGVLTGANQGAVLAINHRFVLSGLLEAAGVHDAGQQLHCIRAIDKLDKVGPTGVSTELQATAGLSATEAEAVLALFADPDLTLETVETVLVERAGYEGDKRHNSIGRLREVVRLVEASGFAGAIRFDPTIARGLDYYDGIIYETRLTHPKVASIGAVMSGGRYNKLIGLFGKEDVPAVGISLGLDRLLAALQELELIPKGLATVPVYVATFAGDEAAALQIASELRGGDLRVEVDLAGGKTGKQFERASKRGASVVVLAGSQELERGVVQVKDLRTGSQNEVARSELVPHVRALLA